MLQTMYVLYFSDYTDYIALRGKFEKCSIAYVLYIDSIMM